MSARHHRFQTGMSLANCLVAWVILAALSARGANQDSSHWAYKPIRFPDVPRAVSAEDRSASPIDAFVRAKQIEKGIRTSPPSDRIDWLRRITFDLTGLPPSTLEIETFSRDASPAAKKVVIERLLASPRYGERWARHWLDVARYTESQGFEYDKLRENAWHYRDYVIRSFNRDLPYDRFMMEQIAGDVLEPVSRDGIAATSFLVCGPWDEAGNSQANATQRAATREEEMEDLVSAVSQAFLGTTIQCARCHHHKFDPISQEEYYRVKAVFDGIKHGEAPLETPAELHAREENRTRLLAGIAELQTRRILLLAGSLSTSNSPPPLPALPPAESIVLEWNFSGNDSRVDSDQGGATAGGGVLSLPADGSFRTSKPLNEEVREKTLEAWVSLADLDQRGGGVVGIETEGGRRFDTITFGEAQTRRWMAGSEGFVRTRDAAGYDETNRPGEFAHLAITYSAEQIRIYRNGLPYGKPYSPEAPLVTFRSGDSRLVAGIRHTGGANPWLRGWIRRVALHRRALTSDEIAGLWASGRDRFGGGHRTISASDQVRLAGIQQMESNARSQLAALKSPTRTYAGTRLQPAPTRFLKRGDVKSPDQIVTPGIIRVAGLPDLQLPADAPEAERRKGFAKWLANPTNPLPARVMVNRIWQHHFGEGLVTTPSDFGSAGSRPSHPELLDWLASEFIRSGWSIKEIHRRILESETYARSSAAIPESMGADPDNRWLWRMNPRRLEAETLRDALLAASGELMLLAGGPSFRPFEVQSFPVNAYVPIDRPSADLNRRTIFRMNVNSGKDPLLDSLDCPDPSVKTPRRNVTTTPLQALGLMNSSFVQRQSERLASRLEASFAHTSRRIEEAYRICLSRSPRPDEMERGMAAVSSRGLNHLCWALFNSTEFCHVR